MTSDQARQLQPGDYVKYRNLKGYIESVDDDDARVAWSDRSVSYLRFHVEAEWADVDKADSEGN